MLRIFLAIICLSFLLSGCAVFDVTTLGHRVDVLDRRVDSLEREHPSIESNAELQEEAVTYTTPVVEEASERSFSRISMGKKEIQIALNNAGYYYGAVDGKLGSKSRSAISAFQADNGLKVDGVAGQQTKKALLRYLTK